MFKLLLLAVCFCVAGVLSAAPLTIVKDGKSSYCIIWNRKGINPEVLWRAAGDLQSYIYKSTGVKIPVVRMEQRKNRPAFLIGFEKVTTPEGFIVKTVGKDVIISGNDSAGNVLNCHWATGARTGTWYGVSDFLEKQLGVRWFFPGELGEYVPKRKEFTLPELNYSDAPRFEYRSLNYQTRKGMPRKQIEANQTFNRRNRSGRADSWCAWHNWLHHLKKEDHFQKHPEYFAYVGGRRYGHDPLKHGLQVCVTNPEALDQMAASMIKELKARKVKSMLSLSPNDGGRHCECPKCQALDDGVRPDGSRIMTTRMMTYANEMAKRITKVLPDQKMGMYAYSSYREGVSKVKVHPAVTIMEVHNDSGLSYYRADIRKSHLKNLKSWRNSLSKLFFYSFPEGMGGLELPCCQFNNISMLYDNLYAAGVTGFAINNSTSYGAAALNNYFYLKFAWGGIKDRKKFYEETLRDCYGKAGAPVMKAYFADIENRLAGYANSGLQENLDLGYIKRLPGVLTKVYPGLAEKWLPQLKAAAAKTKEKGQKARIQMSITNLEYCQTTVALYAAAMKVVKSSRPDVKVAAEALKLIGKRNALFKKMRALPSNTQANTLRTEQNFRLPFDPNVFAFMMAANSRKSGSTTRIATDPKVDGKLDDAVWKNVKPMKIQYAKDNGEILKVKANVYLARHKGDFYIGFYCEEPLMNKNEDSGRRPDSKVWEENCVDIFFAPAGKKGVYQLAFNSLGTARTFRKDSKDGKWEPKAVVRTFHGKDFWSAEVKLPISSMTDAKDFIGDIWGMNFCRVRRTVNPGEYSCWSPTFGDFNRPERFGGIVVK